MHPQKPELGKRGCPSGANCGSSARTSWRRRRRVTSGSIPGNEVRLRYGYVVKCTGCGEGRRAATSSRCTANTCPTRKLGHAGRGHLQGEGQHPLGVREARLRGGGAAVRPAVQGALSGLAQGTGGAARPGDEAPEEYNWLDDINPHAKKVITAYLEPWLQDAQAEDRFQFERHGYFVADRPRLEAGQPGVQPGGDAAGFVGEGKQVKAWLARRGW